MADRVGGAADPLRRRRIFLGGLVTGAVVVSLAGLAASTLIVSPRQLAAQTAAPPPSTITAAVTRQVLRTSVVIRGTVTEGSSIPVTVTSAYAKTVVTRLPVKAGDRVTAGQLLVEVGGRPVFLLRGALPAYRDLGYGDTGPDVVQLQRALQRIGYADRDRSGTFGAGTGAAVRSLYRDHGYTVPVAVAATAAGSAAGGGTGTGGPSGSSPTGGTAPGSTAAGSAAPVSAPAGSPAPASTAPGSAQAGSTAPGSATSGGAVVPSPTPYLPMSEVTFIPRTSARVTSVSAHLGSVVSGPVLQLATASPTVTGMLNQQQVGAVRSGMQVEIFSEDLGVKAAGVVEQIGHYVSATAQSGAAPAAADSSGDATPDGPGYPLTVIGRQPLPSALVGVNVRLTVSSTVTPAPVLAVPLSAVFASADGTTDVLRVDSGGAQTKIVVGTGVSADGLVAIKPQPPAALSPGDKVVIGAGPGNEAGSLNETASPSETPP